MASRSFSGQSPDVPHLSKGEIADLRGDVEAAFTSLETEVDALAVQSGYPVIDHIVTGTALDKTALPDAHTIKGSGFLQDGVQASVTFGAATTEMIFTANRPGTGGNSITVELETGVAEAIDVTGTVVTITLNTGTSTPDSVKTLCDADADFAALLSVASGGAGVAAVAAATALTGGLGTDLVVEIAGVAQAVVGKVTDTQIPMAFSDDTGLVNTDSAACVVTCNGVKSQPVAVTIGNLESDMTAVESDISTLQSDVSTLQSDVTDLEAQQVTTAKVSVTAAEVKALAATQKTLVAAPGAGKVLQFMGALFKLTPGTEALAEDGGGSNLGIKYTDDSGVQVSDEVEMTGFITQDTNPYYTSAVPVKDAIVIATGAENQALVLDNIGAGEITGNATGDAVLDVYVSYKIITV